MSKTNKYLAKITYIVEQHKVNTVPIFRTVK